MWPGYGNGRSCCEPDRREPIRSLRYGGQREGVGRRLVREGVLRTQLPAEPAGPRRPERGRSSVEGSGAACRLYCERRAASVLCRTSETPRWVPSHGMIAPSRSLSAFASRARAARGLFNVLLAAAASRQGA